jgi:hypothetical protein
MDGCSIGTVRADTSLPTVLTKGLLPVCSSCPPIMATPAAVDQHSGSRDVAVWHLLTTVDKQLGERGRRRTHLIASRAGQYQGYRSPGTHEAPLCRDDAQQLLAAETFDQGPL